eukprot:2041635-Amphidinium_carterae.1
MSSYLTAQGMQGKILILMIISSSLDQTTSVQDDCFHIGLKSLGLSVCKLEHSRPLYYGLPMCYSCNLCIPWSRVARGELMALSCMHCISMGGNSGAVILSLRAPAPP